MKKLFSVLAQVAIVTAILPLLNKVLISSAKAATVTYDIGVNITEGVLTGNQYQGYFSYDDEEPYGSSGFPYFSPFEFRFDFVDTSFQNRFEPKTYTNFVTDCRGSFVYGTFPSCRPLEIIGGETRNGFPIPRGGTLVGVNLNNLPPRSNPIAIGYFRITDSGFDYLIGADVDNNETPAFGKGTVSFMRRSPTTSVPESSAFLALIGIGVYGVSSGFKHKNRYIKMQKILPLHQE